MKLRKQNHGFTEDRSSGTILHRGHRKPTAPGPPLPLWEVSAANAFHIGLGNT